MRRAMPVLTAGVVGLEFLLQDGRRVLACWSCYVADNPAHVMVAEHTIITNLVLEARCSASYEVFFQTGPCAA